MGTENSAITVVGRPFEKGKSGNPGGRPKGSKEIQELAQAQTKAAIERLIHWMMSDNAKASVAAANAILDRGWGKPTQPLGGDPDNPLFPNEIRVTVVRPGS